MPLINQGPMKVVMSRLNNWLSTTYQRYFLCVTVVSLYQINQKNCFALRLVMPKDIIINGVNPNGTSTKGSILAQNTTQLLNELLNGYDKRLRPGFGGPPTVVDVNINIRSMGPISEQEMAYQLDCYFRQSWVDERLRFTGPLKTLPVSVNILERLWKPDTHFFNGQRSYLHTVTTPNKLLRINQDGRILYSMRLTVKASCPMHLENFPMDTQTCPLRFGSHGYDTSDVLYIWTHGVEYSIRMAPDMRLSQFDLIGYPAGNDSAGEKKGLADSWQSGEMARHRRFSTLFVYFRLRRHMGYFMINVYVPCTLLTVISWVAFWINREATADRIALGITTVLTMCFLGIDNRNDLPKVSYSTALDYFVAVCFVFVLATVIQFAGVHFFTKHGSGEIFHDSDSCSEGNISEDEDEPSLLIENPRAHTCVVSSPGANGQTTSMLLPQKSNQTNSLGGKRPRLRRTVPSNHHCCTKFFNCLLGNAIYRYNSSRPTAPGANSVSMIDKAARILFPMTFLVFNIVYWVSYMADESRKHSAEYL